MVDCCFEEILLTFPPFFLGKPNGRIVKREFPTYPQGIIYACQDNAWMDERVMLMFCRHGFETICRHSTRRCGSYIIFGFLSLSHDEFGCECNLGPWG